MLAVRHPGNNYRPRLSFSPALSPNNPCPVSGAQQPAAATGAHFLSPDLETPNTDRLFPGLSLVPWPHTGLWFADTQCCHEAHNGTVVTSNSMTRQCQHTEYWSQKVSHGENMMHLVTQYRACKSFRFYSGVAATWMSPLLWSPDLESQCALATDTQRTWGESSLGHRGETLWGRGEGAKTGGMIPCLVITAGPGYLLILSKQSAPTVSTRKRNSPLFWEDERYIIWRIRVLTSVSGLTETQIAGDWWPGDYRERRQPGPGVTWHFTSED